MILKKISLDTHNEKVYLDAYIPERMKGLTRKALLIIPGGAYYGLDKLREGEAIAQAFVPYGYVPFILTYSVRGSSEAVFPTQLIEASKAIKHIKDNAEEYGIDPENVFAAGFSAGGHLAASLGVLWDKEEIYKEIDMPHGYNKPKGVMLIYPVVTGTEEFSHIGSFYNLLGTEEPSEADLLKCSIEKHVNENSVPAFIMHTGTDQAVNVRNSICLADAYAKNKVPFELHIYPEAPHGVALGNKITECGNEKWVDASIAKWVDNAVYWADKLC